MTKQEIRQNFAPKPTRDTSKPSPPTTTTTTTSYFSILHTIHKVFQRVLLCTHEHHWTRLGFYPLPRAQATYTRNTYASPPFISRLLYKAKSHTAVPSKRFCDVHTYINTPSSRAWPSGHHHQPPPLPVPPPAPPPVLILPGMVFDPQAIKHHPHEPIAPHDHWSFSISPKRRNQSPPPPPARLFQCSHHPIHHPITPPPLDLFPPGGVVSGLQASCPPLTMATGNTGLTIAPSERPWNMVVLLSLGIKEIVNLIKY